VGFSIILYILVEKATEEDDLIFARMGAYVARNGHTPAVRALRDSMVLTGIGDWVEDTWDPSGAIWEDF
jgi:hypothetical protein